MNHDLLLSLLQSFERADAFHLAVPFRGGENQESIEAAGHVLEWLAQTGRTDEREAVIRGAVFPALLSDFLHFVYKALETSRKAKLNVTYALLRKPLQESLFVFERMLVNREQFLTDLESRPDLLHSQTAGGASVHAQRIGRVLDLIGEADRFDADYLAQLRYDKATEDGFDGATNQAVHLITTHPAIRTDPLNINFIFSDWESKLTQWDYLYSRLPYVLVYARRLIEHVAADFATTDPAYAADIERRGNAAGIRWAMGLPADYKFAALGDFLEASGARLQKQADEDGWTDLTLADINVLSESWGPPSLWHRAGRRLRRAIGRLRRGGAEES